MTFSLFRKVLLKLLDEFQQRGSPQQSLSVGQFITAIIDKTNIFDQLTPGDRYRRAYRYAKNMLCRNCVRNLFPVARVSPAKWCSRLCPTCNERITTCEDCSSPGKDCIEERLSQLLGAAWTTKGR